MNWSEGFASPALLHNSSSIASAAWSHQLLFYTVFTSGVLLCNHISCSPTLIYVSSYHISYFPTLVYISSLITSAAVQTIVTSEPYQLHCQNSCFVTLLHDRSSITSAASSHQLISRTSSLSGFITSVALPYLLTSEASTHPLLCPLCSADPSAAANIYELLFDSNTQYGSS